MREEIRRNAPINQVVVTGYSINVYSGPGGSYSTIGYMYRQDVVDVYGIISGFYKIHFDGNRVAYISQKGTQAISSTSPSLPIGKKIYSAWSAKKSIKVKK